MRRTPSVFIFQVLHCQIPILPLWRKPSPRFRLWFWESLWRNEQIRHSLLQICNNTWRTISRYWMCSPPSHTTGNGLFPAHCHSPGLSGNDYVFYMSPLFLVEFLNEILQISASIGALIPSSPNTRVCVTPTVCTVRLHRPCFQRFDLFFCVLLGKLDGLLMRQPSTLVLAVNQLRSVIDKFFCSFAFHFIIFS